MPDTAPNTTPVPTPSADGFERVAQLQFQVIREIADKLDQRVGRLETRLTLILVLIASNLLGISLENAKAMLTQFGG